MIVEAEVTEPVRGTAARKVFFVRCDGCGDQTPERGTRRAALTFALAAAWSCTDHPSRDRWFCTDAACKAKKEAPL